jgi:hypothetical protein
MVAAFTGAEIIWIGISLVLFALPVVIIVALTVLFCSRKSASQLPSMQKSAQERLSMIGDLRSQSLISEAEYEEKRRQILSEI